MPSAAPARTSATTSTSPLVAATTNRMTAPTMALPRANPLLRTNWCAAVARPNSSAGVTAPSTVRQAFVVIPAALPQTTATTNRTTDHTSRNTPVAQTTSDAGMSATPIPTTDSGGRRSTSRLEMLAPAVHPTVKKTTDQAAVDARTPRPALRYRGMNTFRPIPPASTRPAVSASGPRGASMTWRGATRASARPRCRARANQAAAHVARSAGSEVQSSASTA